MKYYEVEFRFADKAGKPLEAEFKQLARELLSAMSASAGFESFEDTDDGMKGYVQKETFDEAALREAMGEMPLDNVGISYVIRDVEDKNWNATWEDEGFEPIVIDDRCIIHDTIHPTAITPPLTPPLKGAGNKGEELTPLDITIDAKQAFGTGNHETTRMIVSRLMNMNLQRKRVLDCGCGTGILSIVASKCGAKDVVAYDIDEWSADNTRHNAELNDVVNVEVLLGDVNVLSHVSGVFDVVLANINRNILLADLPKMKEVMAHGASIILSGFYVEDGMSIAEKAGELGMRLLNTSSENNWCMLEFCTE